MHALSLAALIAAVSPLTFVGHWEAVHGRTDGRLAGASARSFHPGDALVFRVDGHGYRLYGITGPTGGHAVVVSPGSADRTIDFYAPEKHTHVLLYTSPPLPAPGARVVVVVVPHHDPQSRGTYVNIDAVEFVP